MKMSRKEMKMKKRNLRDKRKRNKEVQRYENSIDGLIENLEKEITKSSSVLENVDGNKVRLYHFCSPLSVKGILEKGLNRGFVWMEETSSLGKGDDLTCIPCMTANAVGSDNGQNSLENRDKELVRISFLVDKDDPKLKEYAGWFWNECNEYFDDPVSAYTHYNHHKRTGNNNIQDWFVYEGTVRPEMIESVSLKSSADGKYYDCEELETWTWNGLRYNDLPDNVVHRMCAKHTIYKDYTGYLENERPDYLRVA